MEKVRVLPGTLELLTNDEKGYTLCSRLSWSHNRLIMKEGKRKEMIEWLEEVVARTVEESKHRF